MDSGGDGGSISISSKGSLTIAECGSSHHLDSLNQNHYFFRHLLRALLLFTMIIIMCLMLYLATASPFRFLPMSTYSPSFSHGNNSSMPGKEELELRRVLARAAMPDKTVIITTLNEAWIEPDSIFDLFLESFKIGNQTLELLKHLLVIALDQKAFDHCLKTGLNCYFLTTQGINFSDEALYMTPIYLQMMWRRLEFLRTVLQTGYSFVFTDADIMWLRNPFPHFYSDTDFQISCDDFRGHSTDINNAPNGGFYYVKSNNQSIQFYNFWYNSRLYFPGKNEQDMLNKIKYNPFIKEIGLKMKFLDTAYFGGFCQPSKDLNLVCTMHANCCVGLDNKIHDLKILLNDWRKYLSLPENVRETQPPSWSVPQSCGPRSFHHHTPRKRNGGTRK